MSPIDFLLQILLHFPLTSCYTLAAADRRCRWWLVVTAFQHPRASRRGVSDLPLRHVHARLTRCVSSGGVPPEAVGETDRANRHYEDEPVDARTGRVVLRGQEAWKPQQYSTDRARVRRVMLLMGAERGYVECASLLFLARGYFWCVLLS